MKEVKWNNFLDFLKVIETRLYSKKMQKKDKKVFNDNFKKLNNERNKQKQNR